MRQLGRPSFINQPQGQTKFVVFEFLFDLCLAKYTATNQMIVSSWWWLGKKRVKKRGHKDKDGGWRMRRMRGGGGGEG